MADRLTQLQEAVNQVYYCFIVNMWNEHDKTVFDHVYHKSSSSSSSVYLGSTSNHQTQKHNMNNKNMCSKGQKGRDGTYNCP